MDRGPFLARSLCEKAALSLPKGGSVTLNLQESTARSRHSSVILTGAVLQAEGRILRLADHTIQCGAPSRVDSLAQFAHVESFPRADIH